MSFNQAVSGTSPEQSRAEFNHNSKDREREATKGSIVLGVRKLRFFKASLLAYITPQRVTAYGVSRANTSLWLAACLAVGITTYLSAITIWSISTARSEVPWRDQWVFLQDAKAILMHNWSQLWYPYWGHRPVVARLAAVVGVRWFSGRNTPAIVAILTVQAVHALLLIWIAARLFRGVSWPLVVIFASLIIQLSFSSLQMENLIWAGQFGYILVWATATTAFFLLASYADCRRVLLLIGCLLSACVSTLSVPNGLLVWPVLVLQSKMLRLSVRARGSLIVTGSIAWTGYLIKYQQGPRMGMGASSVFLHPQRSLPIVGVLLAAPVTALSINAAKIIGCVVLAVALYTLLRVITYDPPPILTVYWSLAALALFTFLSLAAGRISPEFVDSKARINSLIIPSRYYTMIFYCWDGLAGMALWLVMKNRREWPQLVVSGGMMILLTIGTMTWQIGEAANWRGYYRELDVAASALIMGVNDSRNLALHEVYPDPVLRSQISSWLAHDRLSIFSEKRATLIGRNVPDPPVYRQQDCIGRVDKIVVVTNGVYRISGWLVDAKAPSSRIDLVFGSRSGRIVGIARNGLRRPDLKSSIGEDSAETAGWQGYIRAPDTDAIKVLAMRGGPNDFCGLGDWVLLP